jgi:uncharacterized protein YebE (UPF0316 family)
MMPVVYSILCASLIYVAILALFGRRILCNRGTMVLGSVSLALSFAMLALITSGVFDQLEHAAITRAGFVGYGISLLLTIGQYWRDAWQARRDEE